MANISNASGEFFFFFNNQSTEQIKSFVLKLAEVLEKKSGTESSLKEYGTKLEMLDLLDQKLAECSEEFSLPFSAFGRWKYANNIESFAQDDVAEVLKEIGDLEIQIEYAEYETGNGFIGEGTGAINVRNGEVKTTCSAEYCDLTMENFCDTFGLSPQDYYELTGETPEELEF